jgi:hypothetical protein
MEPMRDSDCPHPQWLVKGRTDDGRVINECMDCGHVEHLAPEDAALFRSEPDAPEG